MTTLFLSGNLSLSLLTYGLIRLTGNVGCFLSNSPVRITSTAFLPCNFFIVKGPIKESLNFLGPERLVKLKVDMRT